MAEPLIPSQRDEMMELATRRLQKRLMQEQQLDPATASSAGQEDAGVPLMTRPHTVGTSDYMPQDMQLPGPAMPQGDATPEDLAPRRPPPPGLQSESMASPTETAQNMGLQAIIQKLEYAVANDPDPQRRAMFLKKLEELKAAAGMVP